MHHNILQKLCQDQNKFQQDDLVFGFDFGFRLQMLTFFLKYREHSSLLQGNYIHIAKVNF